MIIGRDLLTKLNIDVRFSDKTIKWEDQLSRKELKATVLRSVEPKATKEATDRVIKILDSKYEKADLDEVVNNTKTLNRACSFSLATR